MNAVWKSPSIASYSSMTMRKNSQYTKFFSLVINNIKRIGLWNLIQTRHSDTTLISCKSISDQEIKPFGFEKSAFIFVFLVSGIISSLVLILMEFTIPKRIYSQLIHQDNEEEHEEKLKKRIQGLLEDSPTIQKESILKNLLSELLR